MQPVDLSAAVRDITKLVTSSIPRSVRVIFDLDSKLPPIQADLIQLQQIIMNLVINGAEAIGSERNGALRVSKR